MDASFTLASRFPLLRLTKKSKKQQNLSLFYGSIDISTSHNPVISTIMAWHHQSQPCHPFHQPMPLAPLLQWSTWQCRHHLHRRSLRQCTPGWEARRMHSPKPAGTSSARPCASSSSPPRPSYILFKPPCWSSAHTPARMLPPSDPSPAGGCSRAH